MLRYLGSFLIVVFLCAALGEAFVRFLASVRTLPVAESLRYALELREPPTPENPGTALKPGSEVSIMKRIVRVNSLGFRGPELASADARVQLLGSSVAMGWGLPEEDTISSVLSTRLSERRSRRIDVVNSGVANTNTRAHRAILERSFDAVKPSLVILTYYLSDVAPVSETPFRGILRHSLLATHLYAWVSRAPFLFPGQKSQFEYFKELYSEDSPTWRLNQEELARLRDFCRARGVPLLVLVYPDTRDVSETAAARKIGAIVEAKLDALGIPRLADPYAGIATYAGRERELWVAKTDPHGNKIVSNALVEALALKIDEEGWLR